RLLARLRHARVLRERVREPGQVLDLLEQRLEAVAHRAALGLGHQLDAFLEPVDGERHRREGVLELVRQLAREIPPRRLALGPPRPAARRSARRGARRASASRAVMALNEVAREASSGGPETGSGAFAAPPSTRSSAPASRDRGRVMPPASARASNAAPSAMTS